MGKVIHRKLGKKFKFLPCEQNVYALTRIRPRKWDAQNSLGFSATNGSSNLGQSIWPSDSQQKDREPNE